MKNLIKMNFKTKDHCFSVVLKTHHNKIKKKTKMLTAWENLIILNLKWKLMKISMILMKILKRNKIILKKSKISIVNYLDCKA
jgi:hypothetical protein